MRRARAAARRPRGFNELKSNGQSYIETLDPEVALRLAAACESCALHLAILDDQGVIVYVNDAWARFAAGNGMDGERPCVGMNYLKVCEAAAPADAGAARLALDLRALLSDRASIAAIEYPCHSAGERRWFAGRFWTYCFQGKRYIASAHANITDRVLAEERARAHSERYERLLDALPDAVVGVGRDGIIRFATREAHALFGYDGEELLGRGVEELIPESLRQAHAGHREGFARESSKRRMGLGRELQALRKDGSVFMAELALNALELNGESLYLAGVRDVDEKCRAVLALRRSEERYELASQASNDGLWEYDMKTGSVFLSPRYDELLGYGPGGIPRTREGLRELIHPEDRELAREQTDACLRGDLDRLECEVRIRHADTTYRWFLARAILVREDSGAPLRIGGSVSDITERKVAEEQLLYDAFHDALTGLPNRALFMDRLRQAAAYFRRSESGRFAVLLLDLDRFKNINDTLGHPAGDELLKEVARRLRSVIRGSDTVARLGGDEFAVLLDPVPDEKMMTGIVERIIETISVPLRIHGAEVEITTSVGVVLASAQEATADELLRDADIALYRAKAAGRGRFNLFDKEMHDRVRDRMVLENDLRNAHARSELVLHLQPIVSLESGFITSFEALVRWNHPVRGMVPPGDFIPIAEETGLIVSIGDWVMRDACRIIQDWQARLTEPGTPRISINASAREVGGAPVTVSVSPRQIRDVSIHERFTRIAAESGVSTSKLGIEVTESVLISHHAEAAQVLHKFADGGFRLLLDDFGTGYSSLQYLHELPFHTVKVDRSFVSKLMRGNRSWDLLNGIVGLARSLGLTVVAEGIETEEQLAILRDSGADAGQGYYFSPPLPEEEAFRLWTAGKRWG
ncbi:EAL domain-containing protein [Candidatus Poribacteria bacterium]|nr:EAL domain-containing protein [Candidatus Poribacteria bacterium]